MPEQLGFEQAFRQRAAVEREEQAFGARGQLVEVAGDDFFPVPDSPWMRTVLSVGATCSASRSTSLNSFDLPSGFT